MPIYAQNCPLFESFKECRKERNVNIMRKVNLVSHRMSPKKGLSIQLRKALNENYVIRSLPHKTDNYTHECQLNIKHLSIGRFFLLLLLKCTREKKTGQLTIAI